MNAASFTEAEASFRLKYAKACSAPIALCVQDSG
jgi:hypothetical protein